MQGERTRQTSVMPSRTPHDGYLPITCASFPYERCLPKAETSIPEIKQVFERVSLGEFTGKTVDTKKSGLITNVTQIANFDASRRTHSLLVATRGNGG